MKTIVDFLDGKKITPWTEESGSFILQKEFKELRIFWRIPGHLNHEKGTSLPPKALKSLAKLILDAQKEVKQQNARNRKARVVTKSKKGSDDFWHGWDRYCLESRSSRLT